MPEDIVLWRDNQEVQADDFNNMQGWMGDAIDHVVLDSIQAGKAYSGFVATKSTATVVNVAAGRLYSGGYVYARNEVVSLDVFNDRPVVLKKVFNIVAWGQTVDTDNEPRNFVTDADTGDAQSQTVAMRRTRYCNIGYVDGIESADPQAPAVDANTLLIAQMVVDSTGIVSVTQSETTKLDNLATVAGRVSELEVWRNILAGSIETLRTDLANLARQLLLYTPLTDFQQLVDLVQEIYDKVFRPGIYVWYGTDQFLNEDLSDTDSTLGGTYDAYIDEGLRFPGGGAGATLSPGLVLANPTDPYALVTNGFLLPKPSGSRVRYDCSFPDFDWIEDRILQYTYHSFTHRVLEHSRWRHACGPRFGPCPPSQVWWYQAQHDPTHRILSFLSETWELLEWKYIREHCDEYDPRWPRHGCDRNRFFWRDWVHLPYWDKVYADHSHSGQHICQSFFNAQDGWLTSVTVFTHSKLLASLTLAISGCDAENAPDHEKHTLARTVLDDADLDDLFGKPIHVGDIIGKTIIPSHDVGDDRTYVQYYKIPQYVYPLRIPITPTFLRAGQHYGLHLSSTYDHKFSICNRFEAFAVHQGHFWHSYDVVAKLRLWPGDITPKSLRFKLHFATWGQWPSNPQTGGGLRYTFNLESLQLAGGIGGIEVLTKAVIPEACDVTYRVQVGGVWQPFAAGDEAPDFSGAPTLLPFQVVFTGTTDLMPGISLTPSQVKLEQPEALAFHHVSDEITFGSASTHVKVIAKALGFNDTNHDLDCSIYHGTTLDDTPDTVEDETLPDGSLQRTWTFNTTSINSAWVILDGATDGTIDNFVVAQRIAFATA